MKRALAIALLLGLALPAAARPKHAFRIAAAPEEPRAPSAPPLYPTRSTEPIVFIWPPENMPLAADGEFIFGSISPATGHFTINGTTIAVRPNGAFLAWLPIAPGTFTFHGVRPSPSSSTIRPVRRGR